MIVYVYCRDQMLFSNNNVIAIDEDREFLKSAEMIEKCKKNEPITLNIGIAKLHPEDRYVK